MHQHGFNSIQKGKYNMNKLITWNQLREMEEAQNRFNPFFLAGFPNRATCFPPIGTGSGEPHSLTVEDWSPEVDISEDDRGYLLKADLPEMKKEDVRVTVEDGILCVSGERKSEKEDQKRKFHRIERSFGNFRRSFTLPEDADSTKVTAEFRDGVLKVHLPTTPIARSKAIQVKVQ
jgi:HSP20 family protein